MNLHRSKIIGFSASHFSQCLAIFDSNQSRYFIEKDRKDFVHYLHSDPESFYVLEINARVIACGGFWFPSSKVASLTWGMVHSDYHGKGYGAQMLRYRLDRIWESGAETVQCETSQLTSRFFKKFGFQVESIQSNGLRPGIDRVIMAVKRK